MSGHNSRAIFTKLHTQLGRCSPGKLFKSSRSWGKRSRSCSDEAWHLLNSIAGEPLKGFEPKLTQIFIVLGRRIVYVYKTIGLQRSRSRNEISDELDLWSILFVCYSDNISKVQQLSSTTTSTSTVNCSPRWIVYHNMHTLGVPGGSFRRVWSATTQQQCLHACVVDAQCVAADWVWSYNPRECWLHYTPYPQRPRRQNYGVTQFEIVRQCNSASGRLRDAGKCS